MSLCERNCERCTFIGRCGGCSLCEAAVCGHNCGSCFALCMRRPAAAAYVNGALGGPGIELKSNTDISLPYHIPIIPDKLEKRTIAPQMIAIHAQRVFSRNGERIDNVYLEKGYNRHLNLDEGTKAILECYVKDRILEGMWDKRKSIYSQLKLLQLEAVISPNFSVYEDAPRIDHMHNIRRSVIMYNELLDSGINAIPDISWFNIHDLKNWCSEIVKNQIKVVSFSFQVVDVNLKTSNEWMSSLVGFKYLCQNIPADTKIIIAGLISPLRVLEASKLCEGHSLHVLNQSAYVQARRGIMSSERKKIEDLHYCDILPGNIMYFDDIYTRINTQYGKKDGLFDIVTKWKLPQVHKYAKYYMEGRNEEIESEFNISPQDQDVIYYFIKKRIKPRKKARVTYA